MKRGQMEQDRPLLGMFLMLGFCIVAPMGDAVAKILADKIPIGELLLVRFSVQALILLPLVMITSRPWRMQGIVLQLTILRTLLHILGIGMMFAALRHLDLADAIAIAFVMPFILLIMGHYFLKEQVGKRRIIACLVGFIGTLLVIQPSFAQVGWPALLPVGVAVNFSFFILITRRIAKVTDPVGMQMVSGFIACIVLISIFLMAKGQGIAALEIIAPDRSQWGLLILIGALGTFGHLLMTWSLRYAPSTTLAPMQYLEIPIATLIGWIIFNDLPNGTAAVGIVITLAAGLYVVLRERANQVPVRQPPQDDPVQTPAE